MTFEDISCRLLKILVNRQVYIVPGDGIGAVCHLNQIPEVIDIGSL